MMKKEIYRILGENKEHNIFDSYGLQSQKVIYNGKKPLYTSDNINDAYDMFRRLATENYRDHMILIVDFGILSPEQYLRESIRKFNRDSCSYDDLTPFVEIAEYNRSTGLKDTENEIHIFYKGDERIFRDTLKALNYFELRKDSRDECRMDLWDTDDEGFEKVRTIVSSKYFRKVPDYKPCGKIETWSSHRVAPVNFA